MRHNLMTSMLSSLFLACLLTVPCNAQDAYESNKPVFYKILDECNNNPLREINAFADVLDSHLECWINTASKVNRDGLTEDEFLDLQYYTSKAAKWVGNIYRTYYASATGDMEGALKFGLNEAIGWLERYLMQQDRVKNREKIQSITTGTYCENTQATDQKGLQPNKLIRHLPCLDYFNQPRLQSSINIQSHFRCLEEAVNLQATNAGGYGVLWNIKFLTHETLGLYRTLYESMDKEKEEALGLQEVTLEYAYFLRILDEIRYIKKTQGSLPSQLCFCRLLHPATGW